LNRRINDIIKERGGLLAEEADEIRDEFLPQSNMSSAVQHASTKISGEIDQIVGLLSELILSTAQGRNDFASTSSKLDNCTDAAAVRAISDALIEALQAVEQQHAVLEKQFIAAKSELEATNHALAKVTAQANSDSVTGLVNRRGFDIALERAAGLARSGKMSFSLLMIDIDNFKLFNDRFGYLMGDTVLRLISAVLRQSITEQDVAARYGGEEFAILLSGVGLPTAVTIAENIRTKIMSRELKNRSTGEHLGAITVSIGATAYKLGDHARSIVERGDARLYEAKRSGRNCTKHDGAAEALAEAS
jgi:diguanylate cyclase